MVINFGIEIQTNNSSVVSRSDASEIVRCKLRVRINITTNVTNYLQRTRQRPQKNKSGESASMYFKQLLLACTVTIFLYSTLCLDRSYPKGVEFFSILNSPETR